MITITEKTLTGMTFIDLFAGLGGSPWNLWGQRAYIPMSGTNRYRMSIEKILVTSRKGTSPK